MPIYIITASLLDTTARIVFENLMKYLLATTPGEM
jgi:hypothetical protein